MYSRDLQDSSHEFGMTITAIATQSLRKDEGCSALKAMTLTAKLQNNVYSQVTPAGRTTGEGCILNSGYVLGLVRG